jgi:hypothetical protein
MAQAAVVNQRLVGYSVIRLGCQQATLMEFSVSPATEFSAGALLRATAAAAREAGCMSINFHATSTWRYWNLLYRAGFLRRKAHVYRTARCPEREDASREENWQLVPGDSDVH